MYHPQSLANVSSTDEYSSYWSKEFELFYSPSSGLDIDGAWIDMNEPSSVNSTSLHASFHDSTRLCSSATSHAQTPSSKHATRHSLLPERRPSRTPMRPFLANPSQSCKRELTIAKITCKARPMLSRMRLVEACCRTGLLTCVFHFLRFISCIPTDYSTG